MKYFLAAIICGVILPKGQAWWPGIAEMALGPFVPPFPFLLPYFANPPCGQSPCGQNPIPPCPSHCQNPQPPQSCSITISPVSPVVEVPCSYNFERVDGIRMQVLNDTCGSQDYAYETVVVHGPTEPYMALDPITGYFYRSVSVPADDFVQTVKYRAAGLPNSVISNTVYITFNIKSCVLGLTGPDSARVCLGFPPYTDLATQIAMFGQARNLWLYPQLTFVATNAPPLMPLVFDLANDATPVAGMGASSAANFGINSPNVVSTVGGDTTVYISNYNALTNMPANGVIGIYGASNTGNLPTCSAGAIVEPPGGGPAYVTSGTCCQTLRFSVSPGIANTPYMAGYKDVLVCYEDVNTCTFV